MRNVWYALRGKFEKRGNLMEATITAAVTRQTLIELGIPINRVGFQYLCIAIPAYAKDSMQSLTK